MGEEESIRLPDDIAKHLSESAKSLDHPQTYIVTKALREYLEDYEDHLIVLHRLNDENERILSENDLTKIGR